MREIAEKVIPKLKAAQESSNLKDGTNTIQQELANVITYTERGFATHGSADQSKEERFANKWAEHTSGNDWSTTQRPELGPQQASTLELLAALALM